MGSYVDGDTDDIITALDIVTVLENSSGLHNAKASVIEIYTEKIDSKGGKIPKMATQRYYYIGKGVTQFYDNVTIKSSNNVDVPFISASEVTYQAQSKKGLIILCGTILHIVWLWICKLKCCGL